MKYLADHHHSENDTLSILSRRTNIKQNWIHNVLQTRYHCQRDANIFGFIVTSSLKKKNDETDKKRETL